MEQTFFDRFRSMRDARLLSKAVSISRELWNLFSTGVSLQLEIRKTGSERPRPFVGIWDDIRFAVRNLLKNRAFSLGAIAMLALGIGVNTAIYSVNAGMSHIVQRFQDPDELAFLWGVEEGWQSAWISGQDYLEWKASATAFRDMGVYRTSTAYVSGSGEPQRVDAVHASTNLFPMLGLTTEIGRLFGPADVDPSAPDAAVLTYRLWMERFGGDPDVLGQTVTLNDIPHTVIGVLPKTVEFEMLWRGTGVFTPLALNPAELTWEDRRYRVIGRLAVGAGMEMAQVQLSAIAARLADAHPETNSEVRARVEAFEDFFYSNDDKLGMALSMAGVVAVLLIACVNLANILLAKGTARQGEIAVRLAVGASRWRMIRQLLSESFILAFVGGVAGIYLGQIGTRLLITSSPHNPFLLEEAGIDGGLLTFVVLVSVAAALAFGLAPALLSTKVSLAEGVKESLAGASSGRARKRFRSWILVGQIALTVPLVLTCAIAYLNVTALERVDMGFERDGLLTLLIDLPVHRYRNGAQWATFYDEALEAVGTVPRIESVAAGSSFPVGGGQRSLYAPMIVQGRETEEGMARGPYGFQAVSPEYFATLGSSLRSGRYFAVGDGPVDPQVAIVNEAFVRFYWPDEDALGKQLMPVPPESPDEETPEPVTVVGVVADFGARFNGDPPGPTLYRPLGQTPTTSSFLVVRTGAEPAVVFPRIREAIRRLDATVPISHLRTSETIVDEWLQETRVIAAALGLIGVLALIMATVGLYGMVAYSVAQRTYELGIRMVLGADRSAVRLNVMKSFVTLSGVGLAIGFLISLALAAVMRSQLAMLQVSWIPSVLGIVGVLTAVVIMASYLPARRATAIEPAVALRCE
jgi:putative ABC transport system permease protein